MHKYEYIKTPPFRTAKMPDIMCFFKRYKLSSAAASAATVTASTVAVTAAATAAVSAAVAVNSRAGRVLTDKAILPSVHIYGIAVKVTVSSRRVVKFVSAYNYRDTYSRRNRARYHTSQKSRKIKLFIYAHGRNKILTL